MMFIFDKRSELAYRKLRKEKLNLWEKLQLFILNKIVKLLLPKPIGLSKDVKRAMKEVKKLTKQ